MNNTPEGERARVVFLGRRNVGKSCLMNAIAGQPVSIVSDIPGTTTDPVRKAMEVLPLGPVLLVDTAGLDDDQEAVGNLRVSRTMDEVRCADIALVVTDARVGIGDCEKEIITNLKNAGIDFFIVFNKSDIFPMPTNPDMPTNSALPTHPATPVFTVSSVTGDGIEELKSAIASINPNGLQNKKIIGDMLEKNDVVVLVVPIDTAAPKGRLILPQQQTIRDILEANCISIVTQVHELAATLAMLKKPPRIVVTDSQVFREVRKVVPKEVELTSFSILFARYKGGEGYDTLRAGLNALDTLKEGDKILIAEGCTHKRQCEDIGTVKIPRWIEEKTGKKFVYEFSSGSGWPQNLSAYSLIVHCGGCMLHHREVKRRILEAKKSGIPITNFGLLIAKVQGVI